MRQFRDTKYFCTKDGNVISKVNEEPRILRKGRVKTGYDTVGVHNKTHYVHRMIAECFCRKGEGANQVNHKNGIRHDNRAENLEWVNATENNIHARRVLKTALGEKSGSNKLIEKDIRLIKRFLELGVRKSIIAKAFDVTPGCILKVERKETWLHVE